MIERWDKGWSLASHGKAEILLHTGRSRPVNGGTPAGTPAKPFGKSAAIFTGRRWPNNSTSLPKLGGVVRVERDVRFRRQFRDGRSRAAQFLGAEDVIQRNHQPVVRAGFETPEELSKEAELGSIPARSAARPGRRRRSGPPISALKLIHRLNGVPARRPEKREQSRGGWSGFPSMENDRGESGSSGGFGSWTLILASMAVRPL